MADNPSYDGIKACAAAHKVRPSDVSRAKAAGAPGFRNSRIYAKEFDPWFAEWMKINAPAGEGDARSKGDWELLRVKEQYRKLKIANDLKDKDLMPRKDHEAELRAMASESQKVLSEIPTRLAPELAGLDSVVQIEARLREAINKAIVKLATGEA